MARACVYINALAPYHASLSPSSLLSFLLLLPSPLSPLLTGGSFVVGFDGRPPRAPPRPRRRSVCGQDSRAAAGVWHKRTQGHWRRYVQKEGATPGDARPHAPIRNKLQGRRVRPLPPAPSCSVTSVPPQLAPPTRAQTRAVTRDRARTAPPRTPAPRRQRAIYQQKRLYRVHRNAYQPSQHFLRAKGGPMSVVKKVARGEFGNEKGHRKPQDERKPAGNRGNVFL